MRENVFLPVAKQTSMLVFCANAFPTECTCKNEMNECTKSANPCCLLGTAQKTVSARQHQPACMSSSSFVSGYIHDNYEIELTEKYYKHSL